MNLAVVWKSSKDFRIMVLLLALAAIFFVLSMMIGDRSNQCMGVGGTWSKKYRECENVTLRECVKIGGIFNFCASPCRHYKEENIAEKCSLECIKVCEFIRTSK
jgi:hypothetical protein